jgi:hypothetical protein
MIYTLNNEGENFLKQQKKAYQLTFAVYILSYLLPLLFIVSEGVSLSSIITAIVLVLILNFIFIYKYLYKLFGRNKLIVIKLTFSDDLIGLETCDYIKDNISATDLKVENTTGLKFNNEYDFYCILTPKGRYVVIPKFLNNSNEINDLFNRYAIHG